MEVPAICFPVLPRCFPGCIERLNVPKLTKRIIDALRPLHSADLFAWDNELRGFGVRMKPSGRASYIVQYRTAQGRTRRFAFAKFGPVTPEQARTRPRPLLMDVEYGGDPSAARRDEREAMTVTELCARYMGAARAGLVTTRFHRPK
jgi:Arm DNA-binding domain